MRRVSQKNTILRTHFESHSRALTLFAEGRVLKTQRPGARYFFGAWNATTNSFCAASWNRSAYYTHHSGRTVLLRHTLVPNKTHQPVLQARTSCAKRRSNVSNSTVSFKDESSEGQNGKKRATIKVQVCVNAVIAQGRQLLLHFVHIFMRHNSYWCCTCNSCHQCRFICNCCNNFVLHQQPCC